MSAYIAKMLVSLPDSCTRQDCIREERVRQNIRAEICIMKTARVYNGLLSELKQAFTVHFKTGVTILAANDVPTKP